MKGAFRHIHEYYSPRNISTIKYVFMKNAYKTYQNYTQMHGQKYIKFT
jgi:hypothetical protein